MTAYPLRRRRAGVLALLVVLVTLAHLAGMAVVIDDSRLGDGASDAPRRIDVAFVRELAPTAPPPAAPPPVRPRPVSKAVLAAADAASAASANQAAASAPAAEADTAPQRTAAASAPFDGTEAAAPSPPVVAASAPPEPDTMALAPPPVVVADAASAAAASAPPTADPTASQNAAPIAAPIASPAASSPPAVVFEWPPSTKLSYTLTGNYRGSVEGSARVSWLRKGERYQVHLEVFIGPSFAPLITRRMSSDGLLTDQGLKPLRYDEETRIAFREPRRVTILFEGDRVRLPSGDTPPTLPMVQDTASQFVQLTWLFTMQPQRLRAGESLDVPLALPRHVSRWWYDVIGEELLYTPMGPLATFYVKPRREARSGGDLVVESWFAPSLQYLPVRMRIRQDADTYVDLMLDRAPLQEAAPAPGTR